jgi:putative transcriptional regulator
MTDNLSGRLLVAVPHMLDPNFWRSVVLICEHNEDGALGLIINRPSDAEVFDYLPGWTHLAAEPSVVFQGGPVQPDVAVGLVRVSSGALPGVTEIVDGLALFDLSSDPAEASGVDSLRVFSGYAGWEAGQLEDELATGGWFVVPGFLDDAFGEDPGGLWRTVLRRQGGRLAMYANYPDNPVFN